MSDEVWRDVVGYEGRYMVSSMGRVRSLIGKKKLLSLYRGAKGECLFTRLSNGPKGQTHPVHRLVAMAFLGPRPAGLITCHRNGDYTDNRVANLMYGTDAENARHRILHGTNICGERSFGAKLTDEKVRWLRDEVRKPGVTFSSLARRLGVSSSTVSQAARGETWAHV